jgi:3-hydroxybutyryl-CoA dehydratase
MHVNEEFAAATSFGGRIAHGMLTASVISAAIANKLPGPGTIYLGQNLRFRAPVRPGETVHATVTVTEISVGRRRVTLSTICRVGEKVVIDGDALVMTTTAQSRERSVRREMCRPSGSTRRRNDEPLAASGKEVDCGQDIQGERRHRKHSERSHPDDGRLHGGRLPEAPDR